jgi:hypothetical protein
MALNQTIFSPLTNIEGSLSSFTSPLKDVLQIASSSLPSYQATGWQYRIASTIFNVVGQTVQNVTDLQLTLVNSKKYIINAYLLASTNQIANGIRIAIAVANVETYYAIEVSSSPTALVYGFNAQVNAAASASTNINDYQLVIIRAIAITAASGIPTFTPAIGSENINQLVAMGPGVIYYREY